MENRVRRFRERVKMTQEMLAQKSGVSRSSISEIESGRHVPRVDVAVRLAKALGCSVEELFPLKL